MEDAGEKNLSSLLASLHPVLAEGEFVFCLLDEAAYRSLKCDPLCFFREAEGFSVVLNKTVADELGFSYDSVWSLITCRVRSSLQAVGLLAKITGRLAEAGISVNAVSAYCHDHLLVPKAEAAEALDLLMNPGSASNQ